MTVWVWSGGRKRLWVVKGCSCGTHTHTLAHSAGCSLSCCYVKLPSTSLLCCRMWRKDGTFISRRMLYTRWSRWLCYYSLPVKKDYIRGGTHSLNFIIHRLWFLLLKESLQKIFGNLRCVVVHTSLQEKSGFDSCLELSMFARSCVSPLFSACLIN